jgi:hypothetical protein
MDKNTYAKRLTPSLDNRNPMDCWTSMAGILLSANSGLLICSLLRGFPGPLKTASLILLLRKHMGLIVFPQRH